MAASNLSGEPEQETRVVRIWDDPESRIHFLETVLKDKGWEAVIYHPNFAEDGSQRQDGDTPLPELQKKLSARGYTTSLGEDENGIPILQVRKFGSDMSLTQSVQELGFAKGVTHTIRHLDEPLGKALGKTAEFVKHVASDKARLIGGVYLVGDLILALAGLGNKDKKQNGGAAGKSILNFLQALKDPANALQSAAGVLATIQSLIYMGYAKEGSESMYSELMKHAKELTGQGHDLLAAESWQHREAKGAKGLMNLLQKPLKDYPIQAGAISQIAGQLALIGSGGIRLRRNMGVAGAEASSERKGAGYDMMTGVMSAMGWSLLTKTKPSKIADEDKHPWNDPRRLWQEMSEKPNQFASGFLTAATAAGIFGGKEKGNSIQSLGNMTYLIGDGIMFMTKSEHYGSVGRGNSEMLAEAAERFVKDSPIILGQAEQAQFVQQLSGYLADRWLHEEAKKTKRSTPIDEQEVKELSERIAHGLNARLPQVNPRTNEAAARIAGLVRSFHPMIGEKLTDELCGIVTGMHGVAIDADELKTHVLRQLEYPKELPTKVIRMDDIAQPMADLIFAIPGAATPESVDKLYSAVAEHVRPEPMKGMEPLERAINQTASRDVANAAAPQHKAAAPGPRQGASSPVLGAHTAALSNRPQMGMDIRQ